MKQFQKPSFVLVLIAGLLLAFGCEREAVKPVEAPSLEGLKTDLSDPTMTEADFNALYAKLEELGQNPPEGVAQPQAALVNRKFRMTYGPNLTVGIGGAYYSDLTSEWLDGGTAGSTYIPGSAIAPVVAGLPTEIRLVQVYEWYNAFLSIYQFQLIFPDNFSIWGLYDAASRNYTFLGGAAAGNNSCGAVALGRIAGQITPDGLGIIAGEYGYALTLACAPAVVGGTISLTYTGVAIP